MKINVTSIDHALPELEGQTPFQLEVLRKIPGTDRRGRDHWIAIAAQPIRWAREDQEILVTHVLVAGRWEGTQITPGMGQMPVNISFVTDISLLEDTVLDLEKCAFVAIGIANEV